MTLRRVRLGGSCFDLEVSRDQKGQTIVRMIREGQKTVERRGTDDLAFTL